MHPIYPMIVAESLAKSSEARTFGAMVYHDNNSLDLLEGILSMMDGVEWIESVVSNEFRRLLAASDLSWEQLREEAPSVPLDIHTYLNVLNITYSECDSLSFRQSDSAYGTLVLLFFTPTTVQYLYWYKYSTRSYYLYNSNNCNSTS
jgi:hypothetical protein